MFVFSFIMWLSVCSKSKYTNAINSAISHAIQGASLYISYHIAQGSDIMLAIN